VERHELDTRSNDEPSGDGELIESRGRWRRSRWTGLIWLATFVATFLHLVISRVQGSCVLLAVDNRKCSGQDLLWTVFDTLALLVGIPLLLVIGGLFFSSSTEEHPLNDPPSPPLDNGTAAAIGLFLVSLLVFVPSLFATIDGHSGSTVSLMVVAFVATITSGVAIWVLACRRPGTRRGS
jgi:hypothetical protein